MSGRDEASEGSVAMEEDQDDDLYSRSNGRDIKDEAMQQSAGEYEEEEEDESDSVSSTNLANAVHMLISSGHRCSDGA
jgi:hypothetical protein